MKKIKCIVAISLTLQLLLATGTQLTNLSSANFFPDPGPDLPRIYIRSNGDVEPETAPIARAGDVYKLTGNIAIRTIVIQRDNIVLDGSHYLIEGNKSWTGLAPNFGDAGNNGIIITGRNNINITNLSIERFTAGVRIYGSSHINIVGNSFNEETAVFDTPTGIIIEASSHVLIENNNFTGINGPAIFCNGTNITIRDNSLSGIVDAIDGSIAVYGSSNTITDNKIDTTSPSIRLGSADSNIIARNHVTGGISLVSASNNRIFQNNLTSIRFIFSSNNTIFGNNIANNLVLEQGTVNNTFYANAFSTNFTVRIQDAGTNFWDNGTIGNYWADYNGTDGNGDGIGDSPYTITAVKWDTTFGGDVSFGAGQDNYPLMAPYNVENKEKNNSVLPQAMPLIAGLATVSITVTVGVTSLILHRRKRRRGAKQT
ncbi:MAG: right-handed parallel beta-helix repeat-containing protein [Candidatus Bathyarchaeota archaeon]|nr:right-handed parallel beta-helix repeat-containing protein [Candidatus Bathyarchaeota archaeon]